MNDLAHTPGTDNQPGLVDDWYLAAASEVDSGSLPALAVAGELKITADLTLLTNKKFGKLYIVSGSAKLEMKQIGEMDSENYELILTGRYPKMATEMYNWLRQAKGVPCVLVYRMASTGKRFALGLTNRDKTGTVVDLYNECRMTAFEGTTGEKGEDQNGGVFTFRQVCNHGPIEYSGAIDVTG